MEFGVWVKVHRKHVGISAAELSKMIGKGRTTIYLLEARKHSALLATVQMICEAFELPMWEAFFYMEKCDSEDYRPEEV